MNDGDYIVVLAVSSFCTALFTLGVAFFTGRTASAARRGVDATTRTHEASLYIQYMQQYASEKMLFALRTLRDWADKYGKEFVNEYEKAIFKKDSPNFRDAYEVDIARRYVKNFYTSALQLFECDYVKRQFIENVTEYDGIYILYDYVEPLEEVLQKDYKREPFKKLKEIHPDKRTQKDKDKVRKIAPLR
jgi:hypothetical protein